MSIVSRAPTFAEAFAPAQPSAEDKSKKKKGRKRTECDGDELFLPQSIRTARRKNANHWSAAEKPPLAWTPPVAESENTGPPLALPDLARAEDRPVTNLEMLESGEAPAEEAHVDEGEDLEIESGDEPQPQEMLSPEESAEKAAIWNEANRDFLEYWAISKGQKKDRKRKEAAVSAHQEEQNQLAATAQKARLAREGRQRSAAELRRVTGDWQSGQQEDTQDISVVENLSLQAFGRSPKGPYASRAREASVAQDAGKSAADVINELLGE